MVISLALLRVGGLNLFMTKSAYTYHLDEIRYRCVYFFGSWLMTFGVCYVYAHAFIKFLVAPLSSYKVNHLIYTHVLEAFQAHLYISVCASLVFVSAYAIYQFICFHAPGWSRTQATQYWRGWFVWLCWSLVSLWVGYALVPYVLGFFLTYGTNQPGLVIELEPRVYPYISMSIWIVLSVYLSLQIPYAGFYVGAYIPPRRLAFYRPVVWVCCLLVGALISPPDIWSQSVLASGFACLYESFLLACEVSKSYKRVYEEKKST
uniref:SecY-independent transporter protein n=1 Tax=Chloroparvula japonica TaxID=1411623 RepID=A0A4D6C5X3_9CHLO|nr:SecY-independent transporter protein [Chloroparvula japonica]QBX98767.1 SecY-independent transporter protein [Chloroparvula japonica]